MTPDGGSVVLVATPIGNLGDISERAVEALRGADVVACEDTRRTGTLLKHLGIAHTGLISFHEHNEAERSTELLAMVREGMRVVVVSDSGTPGLSDPGERLVALARAEGLTVTAVPGPAAAIMALVISGLPTRRFVFEGFLPTRGSARQAILDELATCAMTTVFYEAPHRLQSTVDALTRSCGVERRVFLGRELTKLHEESWGGSLGELLQELQSSPRKGECVLVVDGAPERCVADDEIDDALESAISRGLSSRDAIVEVAATLRVSRNRVARRRHRHE